ncbi:hypothetical protein GCM10020218_049930 [Dactylosporangium vinaceum]
MRTGTVIALRAADALAACPLRHAALAQELASTTAACTWASRRWAVYGDIVVEMHPR